MSNLSPDKDLNCTEIKIPRRDGKMIPALVLSPKASRSNAHGVLWIRGSG